MTDDNLSELTDEPTIVETDEDGISISRWQKYGHDRLYVNGVKNEVYVDLQAGTVHGPRTELDIDADAGRITVTRRVGWDGNWTDRETVISLTGDVPEDDDDDGGGAARDDDDQAAEAPVAEVPPRVPYNSRTAGIAQQINAQRLVGGREETDG